jgi:hypothetical protein
LHQGISGQLSRIDMAFFNADKLHLLNLHNFRWGGFWNLGLLATVAADWEELVRGSLPYCCGYTSSPVSTTKGVSALLVRERPRL